MKKLYTLLGIVAIGAVIGLTVFGCDTGSSGGGGGGGGNPPGKPTELPDGATQADAIAKLNEIINHPNTLATVKAQAETLKATVEAMTPEAWATGGAAKVAGINTLVDTIPDKSTLFITDVPGNPNVGLIAIFIVPLNTPESESAIENAIVAGADGSQGHVSLDGTILVAELYTRGTTNRWTGSGTYNVYALDATTGSIVASKAMNVLFTAGAARISVSQVSLL
ncbi:MAG: hypothetical protein LBT00_09185 [Spirochaetaceae bacterium]|jgi:hypothetical protein|nr:hypothetical protein [Spirochaetaceae bacterium]